MNISVRAFAAAILFLWLGFTGSQSYAQLAVIDVSNLEQSLKNYAQMIEQVNQLKAQLQELKSQYAAVTGSYGLGSLLQGNTVSAANIVPGSWQDVVRLQQSGAYGSKMAYYESLMKSVDPTLFNNDTSRSTGAYQLSYDNTRAAFAVTDAAYDAIDIHRQNIEQLIQQIDTTQNVKEAIDLNNRLVSESIALQISIAKLAAVQSNLSATAQNNQVQSQATRTEMLRFDPNYQYGSN